MNTDCSSVGHEAFSNGTAAHQEFFSKKKSGGIWNFNHSFIDGLKTLIACQVKDFHWEVWFLYHILSHFSYKVTNMQD